MSAAVFYFVKNQNLRRIAGVQRKSAPALRTLCIAAGIL